MTVNLYKFHKVGDIVNLGSAAYRIVSEDLNHRLDSLPGGKGIRPCNLIMVSPRMLTVAEIERMTP